MRISDWSSDVCSSDLRKQNVLDLGSAAAQHMNPAAFDRCVMKRKNRCVLHSSRCVTSLASTRKQVNLCFLCALGVLCGWLCGFRFHAVALESPGDRKSTRLNSSH